MESLVSTGPSWAFRVDFRSGERWTLDTDDDSILLSEAGKRVVTFRSLAPGLPLNRQDMMTVEGLGYESKEDAERAAKRWRDALALFSVVSGATIDFGTGGQRSAGDRKTDMYNSPEGRIASISTGMTIYRPDVTLQFASVSASLSAAYPLDQFARELMESFNADADLNEDLFAACTLYNSSMLADIQSVRLVLLVTAVECLSEQESASDPAKLMIAELISRVQSSGLTHLDQTILIGRLREARKQSITAACRQLVDEYLDGEYQGQTAARFFKDRYDARSRFVHSGEDYDYNNMVTDNNVLQRLVADLIQAIARGRKASTAME